MNTRLDHGASGGRVSARVSSDEAPRDFTPDGPGIVGRDKTIMYSPAIDVDWTLPEVDWTVLPEFDWTALQEIDWTAPFIM